MSPFLLGLIVGAGLGACTLLFLGLVVVSLHEAADERAEALERSWKRGQR
jgi:hypothetical protein